MRNQTIFCRPPAATARIHGSAQYPKIEGMAWLFPMDGGTVLTVRVSGLPPGEMPCGERIFGFHLHEGAVCSGSSEDPFANTGGHFNPGGCLHPEHAGDLPPLFGSGQGTAMMSVFTDRFRPEEAIGRTLVVHDMPDDFKTQPSGGSGAKIACGEVVKYSSAAAAGHGETGEV